MITKNAMTLRITIVTTVHLMKCLSPSLGNNKPTNKGIQLNPYVGRTLLVDSFAHPELGSPEQETRKPDTSGLIRYNLDEADRPRGASPGIESDGCASPIFGEGVACRVRPNSDWCPIQRHLL